MGNCVIKICSLIKIRYEVTKLSIEGHHVRGQINLTNVINIYRIMDCVEDFPTMQTAMSLDGLLIDFYRYKCVDVT